jgi:hypothetical protein
LFRRIYWGCSAVLNAAGPGVELLERRTLGQSTGARLLLALDWFARVETEPVNSERQSITYVIRE